MSLKPFTLLVFALFLLAPVASQIDSIPLIDTEQNYIPESLSSLPGFVQQPVYTVLNNLLNSWLENKENPEKVAFALALKDLSPITQLIGFLISFPLTLLSVPFLSLLRVLKCLLPF